VEAIEEPGRAAAAGLVELPVTRIGAGDSEAETEGCLDAKRGDTRTWS